MCVRVFTEGKRESLLRTRNVQKILRNNSTNGGVEVAIWPLRNREANSISIWTGF